MTPPVAVIEPEIAVLPELGPEAVNGSVVGLNGAVRPLPPGTRIEVLTASTPAQAAAVMAAVEHFLAETAPAPALNGNGNGNGHQLSGWHRAAIDEAITVRQRHNASRL